MYSLCNPFFALFTDFVSPLNRNTFSKFKFKKRSFYRKYKNLSFNKNENNKIFTKRTKTWRKKKRLNSLFALHFPLLRRFPSILILALQNDGGKKIKFLLYEILNQAFMYQCKTPFLQRFFYF